MKKYLYKMYLALWIGLTVLMNGFIFGIPFAFADHGFSPLFWGAYAVVMVMQIAQLVVSLLIFGKSKTDGMEKIFLNMPLRQGSYLFIALNSVLCAILLAFPPIPRYIAIVVTVLVTGVYLIRIFQLRSLIGIVEDLGKKVKKQTFTIRSLSADAKVLIEEAKSDTAKAAANKVYEAIRYSDPMSNDNLLSDDLALRDVFAAFSDAVLEENEEEIQKQKDKLLIVAKRRSEKCKLLK